MFLEKDTTVPSRRCSPCCCCPCSSCSSFFFVLFTTPPPAPTHPNHVSRLDSFILLVSPGTNVPSSFVWRSSPSLLRSRWCLAAFVCHWPFPRPAPPPARQPCAARMEVTASACDFHNEQTLEWEYGEGDSSLTCETSLPETTTIKCDHVAWGSGETQQRDTHDTGTKG